MRDADKILEVANTMRFVGISGSLRKNSFNTLLLKAAAEMIPEGVSMDIVSISSLPLFNSDLDNETVPTQVRDFREALSRADAFVLASPEYNYSIPGTIKNAIDWASRGRDSALVGKPVALMGATMGKWGTTRMQLAFRPIFQYLDMIPVNKPEVLVAQAQNKFDGNGRLIDDQIRESVHELLLKLKTKVDEQRVIHELEQQVI